MFELLFKLIFKLIIKLFTLLISPIIALISSLLPDFSTLVDNVINFFDTQIVDYFELFCDLLLIPRFIFFLLVDYFLVIATIQLSLLSFKLIINVYNKLKP